MNEKLVMACNAFMTSKRQEHYEEILRSFFECQSQLKECEKINIRTDMEKGMANAWKNVCEENGIEITLSICSFHWKQLIQRDLAKMGLSYIYEIWLLIFLSFF